MAEIKLIQYRAEKQIGVIPSIILIHHYVQVFWDDVALILKVYELDQDGVLIGQISSGPDLGAEGIDYTFQIPQRGAIDIVYTFCTGANLTSFFKATVFPYAGKKITANHFSCAGSVCDLAISDIYTTIVASDSTVADGSIQVTATSSNSPIKYSLDPDFDYTTQGQTSGVFINLFSGTYTVTAKDSIGCVSTKILTVGLPSFYNPKYRLEYLDFNNNNKTRVDIEERGYTGEPIEVKGTDDPFVLRYRGEGELDPFFPIIPSQCDLNVISEENFFFRDLFTQDERKYLIKYYRYVGTGDPSTSDDFDLSLWNQVDRGSTSWLIDSSPSWTRLSGNSGSNKFYFLYPIQAGKTYTLHYQFTISNNVHGVKVQFNTMLSDFSVGPHNDIIFINTSGNGVLSGTFTWQDDPDFFTKADTQYIYVQVFLTSPTAGVSVEFNSISVDKASTFIEFEERWRGYVIGSNYSEAYLAPPYPVTITATDGLADLKNYDFADANNLLFKDDITVLRAITEILSKTDLGINIQCAVNKYEQSMDTAGDPFNQCMFDPQTYYSDSVMNCYDVLSDILHVFGARIYESKSKFIIAGIEQFVGDVDYREFLPTGILLNSGTFEPIVNIDSPIISQRAAFEGATQNLEVIPTYGIFNLVYDLIKSKSLVASYSFEPDDVQMVGQLTTFKNWNVNISDSPGAIIGIKQTKAFEGDYNFYYQNTIDNTALPAVGIGSVSVLSKSGLIEFNGNDSFEYGFSYAVMLRNFGFNPNWVKLQWLIKVGDYYFSANAGWTQDEALKYNDIYVSTYNDVQSFKVSASFRDLPVTETDAFFVEFILATKKTLDFYGEDNYTTMKAFPTLNNFTGLKVKTGFKKEVAPGVFINKTYYYALSDGIDAESTPDIVRPNDFDNSNPSAPVNAKLWKLEATEEAFSPRGGDVAFDYLDNVVLSHFPNSLQPPDTITTQKTNNVNVKVDFTQEYHLNDIDIDNINNSERTYINFLKLLNGTPTQIWTRTYRVGTDKILSLLTNEVYSQLSRQGNKLVGNFITDIDTFMSSTLNEVNDGNRKYMFMGHALHDKSRIIEFDLAELKDTINADSPDYNAGYSLGFSPGFRS